MFKKYNKADNTYANYIHISELDKTLEALKRINGRIKYETFGKEPDESSLKGEYHLIINDVKSLEECIKTEMGGKIEATVGNYHSSLFLECCLHSAGLEGIEYLIKRGAEINRTNLLGNNALMCIVQNDNMATENKFKAIQMLVDAGIDINRPNVMFQTPLMEALNRSEFILAEILIDNGGYVLRLPAREEVEE